MESHDSVLGQNAELSLGQNHHDLLINQDHSLGVGRELEHDHRLVIVHEDEHNLDMGNTQGNSHDPGLGHPHDDSLLGHHKLEHQTHVNELPLRQGHDAFQEVISLPEHGIAIMPNHEHNLVDSRELCMEQGIDTLDIDPSQEAVVQLPMAVGPVLQSRSLVVAPENQLIVGQEFADVQSCRRAIRDTAIACHFEIQTVKSDKTRFTAKCAADGCPWRIHAAKLSGVPTFTIRTISDNHTCSGINHLGHQQASVQWIANTVEERLRENPLCKPKEILEEIHRTHGITLSYKQAWRGKERIMAAVRGSFEEGYRLLPQYCRQIQLTNPGSIAHVEGSDEDNCFRRLFISFHASIFGFVHGCRPLIGLDRTPMKSKYLGTLLIASGFDGEGAVFPLAFGVVDEETDDNWIWFVGELHKLLEDNTENMPRLAFLSDRRKGIVEGVDFNFPTAFHGYCMRHLSESFRKDFNDDVLVGLLWEAAHALTVLEFEAKIIEIEEISHEAAFWIRRVAPRLWATAYFEGTRYGHLTANIVETMNSWLSEASGLPVVEMMEAIRRQLMTWFNERREASMQWTTVLVPAAERRVAEFIERQQGYHVVRANEAEFEVGTSPLESCTVDIRNRCCFCRGWQMYGIPCVHGVAALLYCRQNVHRYSESCFTVANYRKTYAQTIHPIPDKTIWKELSDPTQVEDNRMEEMMLSPPKCLRSPSRPRKKRVRAEDRGREKRVVHCSRCNQTGHFRTTCSAPV